MPADVQESPPSTTVLYFATVAASVVILGQMIVILGFTVGWFLVAPSLTDAQIANGEGGFHWSQVGGWADDVTPYMLVIAGAGLLLAAVWGLHRHVPPAVLWGIFAVLTLVIPAQQSVLGSVFN